MSKIEKVILIQSNLCLLRNYGWNKNVYFISKNVTNVKVFDFFPKILAEEIVRCLKYMRYEVFKKRD